MSMMFEENDECTDQEPKPMANIAEMSADEYIDMVISQTDETFEELPMISRLRGYLKYDDDRFTPVQYCPRNIFEHILFVSIYLLRQLVEFIFWIVLWVSCPIWGPIYFILKVVKERRKNEITYNSK